MKGPEAPDPKETATAQAGMNRDTAISQQLLNMTNQTGPDGTLTYDQTGSNSFVDADGKTINIPQFTATTTLSPEQQAIKAQSDKASLNLGTLAAEQSAKLQGLLNEKFEFNNQDAADWAYDLGASRLDPRFERQRESERTRLINSGIREGTPAYKAAMDQIGQNENDAYNQLMLTGRSQAFQEAQALRSQPINEITALMSGSQVSMPNFQSTPQTGVGGVDYTGLVNQKYQADVANHQASMGGLFGLMGTGLYGAMKFSDRRLKRNIRRIGSLNNGLPVYAYQYKSGGSIEVGLMSDDVRRIRPEAVAVDSLTGFDMVDYALATEA